MEISETWHKYVLVWGNVAHEILFQSVQSLKSYCPLIVWKYWKFKYLSVQNNISASYAWILLKLGSNMYYYEGMMHMKCFTSQCGNLRVTALYWNFIPISDDWIPILSSSGKSIAIAAGDINSQNLLVILQIVMCAVLRQLFVYHSN